MSAHFEVWSRETANLLGWYHSEAEAGDYAARIYVANPEMPPGEIIVLRRDQGCEPSVADCDAIGRVDSA